MHVMFFYYTVYIGYIGLDPVDTGDLTNDYGVYACAYSLTINSIIFANVPSMWNKEGRACTFYNNKKNAPSINKVVYNFINEGAEHCAFSNNGCRFTFMYVAKSRGSLSSKSNPDGYLYYVAEKIKLFVNSNYIPDVKPSDNVLTTCP